MVNILTAIGNPEINEKLKNNYNIIGRDIQYKEGILEILENNKEINYIIINEKLSGNIKLENLLREIKKINNKIKIIVLINENSNLQKFKSIIILKFDENIFEKIKNIIEENENNKLILKIENTEKNNLNYNNKKIEENKSDLNKNNIFAIKGAPGVGKTINSILISYFLSKRKFKVLLIDLNDINGNLHTIFQKPKNINEIQKISNELHFLVTNKNKLNVFLEKNYDFYIIDNLETNNYICNNIFIVEPNLVGISKIKNILNKEIKNEIIILNKKDKYSIEKNILKNIFENKNILEINYSSKFNLIVNNFNIFIYEKYFKKQYKKIVDKIIKENIKKGIKQKWN